MEGKRLADAIHAFFSGSADEIGLLCGTVDGSKKAPAVLNGAGFGKDEVQAVAVSSRQATSFIRHFFGVCLSSVEAGPSVFAGSPLRYVGKIRKPATIHMGSASTVVENVQGRMHFK